MRIVIVGGHGKVALLTAPLLTAAGHHVTSLIRNGDQSGDVAKTGAAPVVADVETLETAEIATYFSGHDAVVWAAGAGGGSPDRTRAVDRDAAIRSMDAATAAGVDRYVMVSYFGAGPNHGVPPDNSFFAYAEAKSAADAYLEGTDLAWTILRPSTLTSDPGTGSIEAGDSATAGSVARADVAQVIAAVLARPATARAHIAFNSGGVPIEEAIGRSTR